MDGSIFVCKIVWIVKSLALSVISPAESNRKEQMHTHLLSVPAGIGGVTFPTSPNNCQMQRVAAARSALKSLAMLCNIILSYSQ